jgi:deoxyribonuclease V
VDTARPLPPWSRVAAADVSYNRGDTRLFAAVVVYDARSNEVIERVGVESPMVFPYVPGLLSFREAPGILEAFGKLKSSVDVVLCDGQGIAHPRRVGLASHLGLWLEIPTIGCAKSLFCGTGPEPGLEKGSTSPLMDRGEQVGVIVRTKRRVKPLYVSPGHLLDLASAVDVVLSLCQSYRLPEPARFAHQYVNALRLNAGSSGK